MDNIIMNNDREYANWNGDSNSHGGYGGHQKDVRTSWDQLGQPHTVTQDEAYTAAQPTNAWTQWSDPYTTATATATESWMSQATSQSQTAWTATATTTATDNSSLSTTTSQASTTETATTSKTSSTGTSSAGTSTLPTSSATSASDSASSSGLPLKTKLAIALPISIIGTAVILALLFFIRRRRSKHGTRSGPYMDIRDPSSSRIHVHSHSQIHSFSQGENDNPWDYLGPTGAGYGTSQPVITGGAARNSHDTSRSSIPRPQQQQIRGSHTSLAQSLPPSNRPSLSVLPTGSAAGFGFLPDPLHSHPNTPTTGDERDPSPGPAGVGAASIGLARTTSEEHGHDHNHDQGRQRSPSPDLERTQSPFDYPLDDAVSEISRMSSGRRRVLHGGGSSQGHYYRNVDDDSSVSSVSDDEDEGQVRNGVRRG